MFGAILYLDRQYREHVENTARLVEAYDSLKFFDEGNSLLSLARFDRKGTFSFTPELGTKYGVDMRILSRGVAMTFGWPEGLLKYVKDLETEVQKFQRIVN